MVGQSEARLARKLRGVEQGAEREVVITLPFHRLAPGSYHCAVSIGSGNNQSTFIDYDGVLDMLQFEVAPQRTPKGLMASWAPAWGAIALPELRIAAPWKWLKDNRRARLIAALTNAMPILFACQHVLKARRLSSSKCFNREA